MYLFGEKTDEHLNHALNVAKKWQSGNASVSETRKTSLSEIAVANESSKPTAIAIARSVGHAVATAHMADHFIRFSFVCFESCKKYR